MTWSYSGDPSTSEKDEVRFYIGDVDTADQLLTDEEIEFYLDKLDPIYGKPIATAAYLADILAGRFARELSISADGVSISASDLQDKFSALAKSLRQQWHTISGVGGAPDSGGFLWGDELDPTVKPLVAGMGIHDNDRAGNQEYGGIHGSGVYPSYAYDDRAGQ